MHLNYTNPSWSKCQLYKILIQNSHLGCLQMLLTQLFRHCTSRGDIQDAKCRSQPHPYSFLFRFLQYNPTIMGYQSIQKISFFYLTGTKYMLYFDHKPLTPFFTACMPSPELDRWALDLSSTLSFNIFKARRT